MSVATLSKTALFLQDIWGADKVYRSLAYGSKLIIWYLQRVQGQDSKAAKSIAMLASRLSETRAALRFWGLLDNILGILRNSETDPVLKHLTYLQCGVNLVYHPIDHTCWALGILPPGSLPVNSEWFMRMSSYFWLLDTCVGILKILIKLLRSFSQPSQKPSESAAARKDLWLQLCSSVSNLFLSLNWSLSKTFLTPFQIGVLGLIGSFVGAYRKWQTIKV
jgi:hypothetical protein